VLIGGYVYQDIFRPKKDTRTGKWYIPMPRGRAVGGHEIILVSYDNNLTLGGIKGQVEFQNSWGKSYGDRGTAWAPQAYFLNPRYMEDCGVIELVR
jgi:C1A family cysteine protease